MLRYVVRARASPFLPRLAMPTMLVRGIAPHVGPVVHGHASSTMLRPAMSCVPVPARCAMSCYAVQARAKSFASFLSLPCVLVLARSRHVLLCGAQGSSSHHVFLCHACSCQSARAMPCFAVHVRASQYVPRFAMSVMVVPARPCRILSCRAFSCRLLCPMTQYAECGGTRQCWPCLDSPRVLMPARCPGHAVLSFCFPWSHQPVQDVLGPCHAMLVRARCKTRSGQVVICSRQLVQDVLGPCVTVGVRATVTQ